MLQLREAERIAAQQLGSLEACCATHERRAVPESHVRPHDRIVIPESRFLWLVLCLRVQQTGDRRRTGVATSKLSCMSCGGEDGFGICMRSAFENRYRF
jgi:hypothetical protein